MTAKKSTRCPSRGASKSKRQPAPKRRKVSKRLRQRAETPKLAARKKSSLSKVPERTAAGARAPNYNELSLRQTAAQVREQLALLGYDPVLTGRSCASIYAWPQVKADALDFVLEEYLVEELGQAMQKLGFQKTSLYSYESKRCPLDVIFSPPPLSVGDDIVRDIAVVPARPGKIKLLNPTDCVRQRLSMFYRWGDKEAFHDAVAVAKRHKIDLELVRRWSDWEWCTDKYEVFQKALAAATE